MALLIQDNTNTTTTENSSMYSQGAMSQKLAYFELQNLWSPKKIKMALQGPEHKVGST